MLVFAAGICHARPMTKISKKPGTAVTTPVTEAAPADECEASGTAIAFAIEPTREGYARAIHTVCRRSAVAVGKLLIAAKDRLEHGDFLSMVEEDLPFGERTAEKLMLVARNAVLSNPTHESDLPGTWTVLYELALIDKKLEAPGTLEAWIKRGIVHRDIKREEVEDLVEHELALKDETSISEVYLDFVAHLRSLSREDCLEALEDLCADVGRLGHDFTLSVRWNEEERAEKPETGDATIN